MRTLRAALSFALLTLACSPPSADDLVRQVIQQRNNYDATLQSWVVREDGSVTLANHPGHSEESAGVSRLRGPRARTRSTMSLCAVNNWSRRLARDIACH